MQAIRDLSPLAPLHNPAAILGIEASYKAFRRGQAQRGGV